MTIPTIILAGEDYVDSKLAALLSERGNHCVVITTSMSNTNTETTLNDIYHHLFELYNPEQ